MAGGLGGLGGFLNSPAGGNMLQALGFSLMSSPRNAPLANFGQFYGGLQDRQMRQDALDQERSDTLASREAMAQALIASGVPEQEAQTLAINPAAAKLRLDQISAQQDSTARQQWLSGLPDFLGGAGNAQDMGALGPVGGVQQPSQTGALAGNKTLDWLNQNDPEAAKLVDQGFSVRDAFEIAQVRQRSMNGVGAQSPSAATERPAPKASPATALENLAAQRDRLATMLVTAPDQESLVRGKAMLDALDTRIEREQGKLSKNQTYQYLSNGFPELADMVRAGALSPKDALSIATQQQKAGGGVEYGLTPQTGVDASGNPVLIQLGKDGRAVQTAMPEGVSLSKEPIKLDAGTHFVLLDPITRQPVGTIPKENYRESFDKAAGGAAGKSQAEAAASLPGDILAAEQTADQIDQLIQHPGLSSIVGPLDQYRPGLLLGDTGRDALARYNQLQGRAFLQAYGMLKGGGQITEIEGVKAERAMARMDRAQGEKEFKDALTDFRDAVREGLAKLREKAGNVAPPAAGQAPQTSPTAGPGRVQWSIEGE